MHNMDMSPTIDVIWEALQKCTEKWQKFDQNLQFNQDKIADFKSAFSAMYNDIKTKYMKKKVWALDRHKVAAVIISSAIENEIISYEGAKLSQKTKFLGCEMLATEVALSWMLQEFNLKLENGGYSILKQYTMPEAYACNTSYFEIFCRDLFYARENGFKLNPIDIAEKLFLIEYITMLSNNIDISVLKE